MTAAETSVPMDITMQNPAQCGVLEQDAAVTEPPAASSARPPDPPIFNEDRVLVSVEVLLKPSSTARFDDVRSTVESMLEKRSMSYADGPIPVPVDNSFLVDNVQRICICDSDMWVEKNDVLLFWQVRPVIHVFQLSEEGPCEELNNDGQHTSFNEWILPANEFDGLWESLIYESGLKQRLLRYAASALLFTEKGVNPFLVSWNRIVLLHGPPGTGKTSLCKALAQKLSIRLSSRYPQSQLIEVAKLFSKIQEMVEEENNLVFVLIDEVESLAAARKAALSGSEPSDSIRVVNALLTQMDKLKSSPNVIILTTSNITAAIDIAFVDRADIKAYVGPPTLQARFEILRSCLLELMRTGILSDSQVQDGDLLLQSFTSFKEQLNSTTGATESAAPLNLSKQLLEVAEACKGLSGRTLRKLPFLAHAALANPFTCGTDKFLRKMIETAKRECSETPD
ncbi:pachytene checkpoint protein 2 homolog isoform X2 [Primulina huaijiensis]|uniref:pachytene checkpoint protein 2 homolog isoform X2 n=1 Tax=Primulina huaijiensis TaxID=1492673 RepID=UPI003CC70DA6